MTMIAGANVPGNGMPAERRLTSILSQEAGMGVAYVFVVIVAAAVAVFALQNGQPTALKFLTWSVDAMPLAGAILLALGAGLVVAGLPLGVERWRWRSRARSAEVRCAMLEKALGEREAALLRQRPTPPPAREATP